MRYYIYQDNKPIEVTEAEYQLWETSDKYNFSFEDYILSLDGIQLSIQITYIGVFDDYEKPMPFVLVYSEKKQEEDQTENSIEYYETYEAVINRKSELILKHKLQLK